MAFDIGEVGLEVRTVDDRTLLSPDVLDVVVREVINRLNAQTGSRERHDRDVSMWGSVRDGGVGT